MNEMDSLSNYSLAPEVCPSITNQTLSAWVNADWNDSKHQILQAFYILVAILGTIGNGIVLFVYFSHRELRKNATNIFIINLAISDLTTSLLIIPFKVVTYPLPVGIFGELLCRVFKSQYFLWTSGGASAYTLFWVTIERHFAIIHPYKYDRYFTTKNAVYMCLLSWFVAMVLECYEFVSFGEYGNTCCFVPQNVTWFLICTEGVLILGINVVMLVTYTRIAAVLRKNISKMRKQGVPQSDPRQFETVRAKQRVLRMMYIVLGTYFVCWAGVGVFNIWTITNHDIYSTTVGEIIMLMAVGNSCINPIIYCFKNNTFRQNLAKMFCKGSKRRTEEMHYMTNHTRSL